MQFTPEGAWEERMRLCLGCVQLRLCLGCVQFRLCSVTNRQEKGGLGVRWG